MRQDFDKAAILAYRLLWHEFVPRDAELFLVSPESLTNPTV